MCADKHQEFAIGGVGIFTLPDKPAIFFKAGMTIDADGAPNAYHPDRGKGLDFLGNAGRPGNWWALVTDNGKPTGTPIIQKAADPAPGFYVSATTLEDPTKERTDPRRYVDSNAVPFLALPPQVKNLGAKTGDFAFVVNTKNGNESGAIFVDVGPRDHIGEGSLALARALGLPTNLRDPANPSRAGNAGASSGVIYIVFPGSGNRRPRTLAEIDTESRRLLAAWGGREQLLRCFA